MEKLVHSVFSSGLSNHCGEEESLEEASCTESDTIKSLIHVYLPSVNIAEVKKVKNNYLRGMYNLKKEEYASRCSNVVERTMFHSTSASNVTSIIQNNLDWRRVSRGKFGIGVSFSPDADYANCHSNRNNGSQRAFIIAKVLVGQSSVGAQNQVIPPGNFDTTKDSRGHVIVKYNDNEYLPEFVAYYTCNDISKSKYYGRGRYRSLRPVSHLDDDDLCDLIREMSSCRLRDDW